MSDPGIVVLDIDGVLADARHRLHHLRGRRKNWAAFFAAAGDDPPLDEGVRRAQDAARSHALVYLSGRPERLRQVTQGWLDRHGLPGGALVMRPDADHRPARVLKPQLLARVADRGRIVVVVDDDIEVCEALRVLGYEVEHATWAAD